MKARNPKGWKEGKEEKGDQQAPQRVPLVAYRVGGAHILRCLRGSEQFIGRRSLRVHGNVIHVLRGFPRHTEERKGALRNRLLLL